MKKLYNCDVIYLQEKGPSKARILVLRIEEFYARRMRRIFGRGDHFGQRAFHMDVWQARSGSLFARFWSRGSDVERLSFKIIGFPPKRSIEKNEKCGDNEHWVPECLRREYDRWVMSEL